MAGKWFSAALNAARSLQQPKGTPQQMINQIRKTPGVKPEEMEFLSLDELMDGTRIVTRDELQLAIIDRLKSEGLAHDSQLRKGQVIIGPESAEYAGKRAIGADVLPLRWEAGNDITKYDDIDSLKEALESDGVLEWKYSDMHDRYGFYNPKTGDWDQRSLDLNVKDAEEEEGTFTMLMEKMLGNGEAFRLKDTYGDKYNDDWILDTVSLKPSEAEALKGKPGRSGFAKFPEWSAMGYDPKSNYKERVLVGGKPNVLQSVGTSHYNPQITSAEGSEMPVLGHSRGGMMWLPSGSGKPNDLGPMYVADEVQSDLHQAAAKQAKRNQEVVDELYSEPSIDLDEPLVKNAIDTQTKFDEKRDALLFKKSWPELLMKDQLNQAAYTDAKYFGITDGWEQMDRFGKLWTKEPGLGNFYNDRIKNSKFWKQMGLDRPVRGVPQNISNFRASGAWYSKLPEEVKERIRNEGLPLFSLGALATYGPYQNQGALYE